METPSFAHYRLHGRKLDFPDLVRAVLHPRRGSSGPTRIRVADPLFSGIRRFFEGVGHPEWTSFMGAEVEWADIPKGEVWLINEDRPTEREMNLILHVDETASHDQFLEGCCEQEKIEVS